MYAVIETGGKQYRVEVGTELEVELLDADQGDSVTLDRVLLVADGDTASIGQPLVANAKVAAEVVRQMRGEKVISFKYRPKARRRVKKGHRQELTLLRVSDIVLDGKSAAASAKKAEDAKLTERQRLEDAARKQAEADAALAEKLRGTTSKAKADATDKADKPASKASTAKADTKKADTKKADAKPAAKASTAKASASKSTTSKAKADADAPATKSRTRTKKDE